MNARNIAIAAGAIAVLAAGAFFMFGKGGEKAADATASAELEAVSVTAAGAAPAADDFGDAVALDASTGDSAAAYGETGATADDPFAATIEEASPSALNDSAGDDAIEEPVGDASGSGDGLAPGEDAMDAGDALGDEAATNSGHGETETPTDPNN